MNLENITNVSLYTGDNGASGCTCNCPCCSQKARENRYQGNMSQALIMFEKLPNLEQLYLFGNPDPTVDTELCHEIMKEAVKRGIHVCFSTSGVGGKLVLEQLLEEIPTNMVDYVSFSFDGTTPKEMSFAKGINYPMEKAIEGVRWALENGYTVKVQPTLWLWNYNKVGEIINFFYKEGVKWFTFHVGSLESNIDLATHQHLLPWQIKVAHEQIDEAVKNCNDIKVRCPIIYPELGANEPSKWYCMHPERAKELLILFTQNGIEATHAPIASNFRSDLTFMIDGNEVEKTNLPKLKESNECPFSYALTKHDGTCCRYVSRYWNY